MYVKKFESNTLDQALKDIKQDLGPDAIILKTITNKGLRKAFKKKKIEITAAISEKNYLKKSKVDAVLNEKQAKDFYSNQSDHISQMIDHYDTPGNQDKEKETLQNYEKIGINKSVKKVIKSDLDNFLEDSDSKKRKKKKVGDDQKIDHLHSKSENELLLREINLLNKKILELEKRIDEKNDNRPYHLLNLQKTLRSFEIDEKYIQEVMGSCEQYCKEKGTEDLDLVYEFTLKEMLSKIKTQMPLFSKPNSPYSSVITFILSESQNGQSCMTRKLAALNEGSVIITNHKSPTGTMAKKLYNIESIYESSFSEIINKIRQFEEKGKNIFVDYKNTSKDIDETKKIIRSISKGFENVEVLICLSAIHSEIYNKKIMSRYNQVSDGLIITNLDLCLNYGHLFNIAYNFERVPFTFFGTGDIVPDDIEAATGERILAGLFQLD